MQHLEEFQSTHVISYDHLSDQAFAAFLLAKDVIAELEPCIDDLTVFVAEYRVASKKAKCLVTLADCMSAIINQIYSTEASEFDNSSFWN